MYIGKTRAIYHAKCPYFRSEFTTTITCEGLTDTSRCLQKFDNEKEKDDYIEMNCLNYPNGCRMFEALEKKYE